MENLDEIRLPAGTLIKINGMPFELKEDTLVLGRQANYNLAIELEKELTSSAPLH